MLMMTRKRGSRVFIGDDLVLTVEGFDAHSARLTVTTRDGLPRISSRVPMESAVTIGDVRIVPKCGGFGQLRIGFDAPRHIQILRDDAKRRTAP